MKKILLFTLLILAVFSGFSQKIEKTVFISDNEIKICLTEDIKSDMIAFAWIDNGKIIIYPDEIQFVDEKTILLKFNDTNNLKKSNSALSIYSSNTGVLTSKI